MLKTKEDIIRGRAGFKNEGVDIAEISGNKQHVVAHPGCSLVGRKWEGGIPIQVGREWGALFPGIPEGFVSASLSRPPVPGRSPCLVLHTILKLAPGTEQGQLPVCNCPMTQFQRVPPGSVRGTWGESHSTGLHSILNRVNVR